MTEKEAKEISMNFVEENKDRPIILHDAIKILVSSSEKKDRIIQQLKDENRTLNRQAQQYFEQGIKKDKIIDLMAIAISNEPLPTEEYCIFRNFDCPEVGGNRDCKECVKQYFERKVEEIPEQN